MKNMPTAQLHMLCRRVHLPQLRRRGQRCARGHCLWLSCGSAMLHRRTSTMGNLRALSCARPDSTGLLSVLGDCRGHAYAWCSKRQNLWHRPTHGFEELSDRMNVGIVGSLLRLLLPAWDCSYMKAQTYSFSVVCCELQSTCVDFNICQLSSRKDSIGVCIYNLIDTFIWNFHTRTRLSDQ